MTTTPIAETLGASQLRQLRDTDPDVAIVDVRTGGEYETAHIPGSYNVPLDVLGDHVGEFANVAANLVLVCQSGARAEQARKNLADAGKCNLQVLEDGMNGWQAAGGDVAHGEVDRWAMDRQVRLAAGSLVLAGLAASTVAPKAKWFAGAIGGGLTFSAVSNTCAMGTALSKLPYNQTAACDTQGILAHLNRLAS